MDKNPKDNPLFVGSFEKGMQVLQAFRDHAGPLGLTELCELTGLGKSAVQRYCYTLVELGLLVKHARSKDYSPSPQLLDFSYMYLRSDPIIQVATPYLINAREECGEAFNLARRINGEVIYTVRLPSSHSKLSNPLVGGKAPIYCTASGRAILSAMDPQEVSDLLEQQPLLPLTSRTITSLPEILELIDRAREEGFTIANQECINGEVTVAAPLIGKDRKVQGAINIATSIQTYSPEAAREELAPLVTRTALDISRALGLSPFA